ncbi:MAG: nucleotidyl transferase AbiEii/AbiGii toxin family protein [Chloroflexota bacterium]
MLTRTQIQRLAQRNSIGMQAQERDYIQHLLLFLLYSRSQELIFKGGTALRIVYRGPRYSENLDFNGPADLDALQSLWQGVSKGMESFGVMSEIRNQWTSEVSYSLDISYQGPLYDGSDRTKGRVRVDINRRQESVNTRRELVSPDYDDLRPFVVTAISLEHMLAEKVRAMLTRGKPRDLYDIWFLIRQGVRPDIDLFNQKLVLYDLKFSPPLFESALENVRTDWERDLHPLLAQPWSWDEIVSGLDELRKL